jgi:hypothetical protein
LSGYIIKTTISYVMPVQMLVMKTITSMGEDVKKKETLHTFVGNVNYYSSYYFKTSHIVLIV